MQLLFDYLLPVPVIGVGVGIVGHFVFGARFQAWLESLPPSKTLIATLILAVAFSLAATAPFVPLFSEILGISNLLSWFVLIGFLFSSGTILLGLFGVASSVYAQGAPAFAKLASDAAAPIVACVVTIFIEIIQIPHPTLEYVVGSFLGFISAGIAFVTERVLRLIWTRERW